MANKFNFEAVLKRFNEAKKELPGVLGTMARNHFADSFRKGGFTDDVFERWPGRKGELRGGIAMVRQRSRGSRAILVKSGALRRSIMVKESSFDRVRIVADMGLSGNKDYAPVHNEGLRAGRGRGFDMPKRKFVGRSKLLERNIQKRIEKEINYIFGID